jgi:hypothetical protein
MATTTRPNAYEVTMVVPGVLRGRIDTLVDQAMGLRRQAGQFGVIGFRDVLTQAIETGVEALERSFADAQTAGRRVLLPTEWAARLGRPGGRR